MNSPIVPAVVSGQAWVNLRPEDTLSVAACAHLAAQSNDNPNPIPQHCSMAQTAAGVSIGPARLHPDSSRLHNSKMPIPFLDNMGVYHAENVPRIEHEVTERDCPGEVGPTLELRYGVLSVMQLLAMHYRVATPALNSLLQPAVFQQRLADIVTYYSDPEKPGKTLTAMDAYNFLRLHAIGGYKGDMRAWIKGLQHGEFQAPDGSVFGFSSSPVMTTLRHLEKNDRDFWQRPDFMYKINGEFKSIREALVNTNSHLLEGSDYNASCVLLLQIVQMVQIYVVNQLRFKLSLAGYLANSDLCTVTCRGLNIPGGVPEDFLFGFGECGYGRVVHSCFEFVQQGWIERVLNTTTSKKSLLSHFKQIK